MSMYVDFVLKILPQTPGDLEKYSPAPWTKGRPDGSREKITDSYLQLEWSENYGLAGHVNVNQLIKDNPQDIFLFSSLWELDLYDDASPSCHAYRDTVSVKINAEEFESINYSEADRILKEPRPRPTQIVVPIDPADLIEEEDV